MRIALSPADAVAGAAAERARPEAVFAWPKAQPPVRDALPAIAAVILASRAVGNMGRPNDGA